MAQTPRDGRVQVVEVPLPVLRPGWVLVHNRCSLISAGTERSKVELGGKSLIQKARARPDLVRKVVDRARVEGVRPAITTARDRLDALAPLGYSSAGVVVRIGPEVEGLVPGARVACAGGGWANHAELVAIPRNLIARVPDNVSFEAAAYATVGAIALHGVRQAGVNVGERVGVVGLGLVGQLAARLLGASGCEVVGVDLDQAAVELAERGGARAVRRDDPALEAVVAEVTEGLGLDAVLVCAATRSADPLALAATLARDRGRLVVVGDVPIEVERAVLYEKELDLRLSRSYGPGRYDRDYEERGRDLPAGYVRWTEQRNLQAFLDLVGAGRLNPTELTTMRRPVEQAPEAYAALSSGADEQRSFGIVLDYPEAPPEDLEPASAPPDPARSRSRSRSREGAARIGVIGAGNFARATLLPALTAAGAELASVSTSSGLTAADVAHRFGFDRAAASAQEILEDESIEGVVIATRHATHAPLAAAALDAGKAVFVEKPLGLSAEQLDEVEAALDGGGVLMVGFNRRFAPLVERMQAELAGVARKVLLARVNAGPLPPEHWLHDPLDGGGRLIGEGCHFVDLLSHLAGAPALSVHAFAGPPHDRPLESSDELAGTLRFGNGSVGTLVYAGTGDPRMPKERIEAFGGGASIALEDFRRLDLFRAGKRTEVKGRQDKGHAAQMRHFVEAVRGRAQAPPAAGYLASSRATLALAESLQTGAAVEIR